MFCRYVCNYWLTDNISHKQYTVCMLRYIPQYQMSAPYPVYSTYATVYTAVPTVSLLSSCFYARTFSDLCMNQNTHHTVCRLRINGNLPPATTPFHTAVYTISLQPQYHSIPLYIQSPSNHNIIPYRCIYNLPPTTIPFHTAVYT